MNKTYITINHLDYFDSVFNVRVDDVLTLRKDKDNPYDDEAIVALKEEKKIGYVANSVKSVVRGTQSSGRVYDSFEEETKCKIRFIYVEEGSLIAEV